MAWDKAKPAGGQKIRLSDEEIRENWNCLEDALGREHTFPGVFGGTAGEHAAAAEGSAGQIELASQAEAIAGVEATKAITSATLKAVTDDRIVVADQAEVEAGALNTKLLTPANIKWAPGIGKAFVQFDSTGAIGASLNVASVNRNGVGDFTINFTTPFSNDKYITLITAMRGADGYGIYGTIKNAAAWGDSVKVGSVQITTFAPAGNALADPVAVVVACFGDQ